MIPCMVVIPMKIRNFANMNVKIEQSWKEALAAEWEKPYFAELASFVR